MYFRKYDSTTTDFDIALIEMNKPVEFNEKIKPICMMKEEEQMDVKKMTGKKVTVAGWGHTMMNGEGSKVLRAVNVTLIPNR